MVLFYNQNTESIIRKITYGIYNFFFKFYVWQFNIITILSKSKEIFFFTIIGF